MEHGGKFPIEPIDVQMTEERKKCNEHLFIVKKTMGTTKDYIRKHLGASNTKHGS